MESFDEHGESSQVLFITVVSARGLPKTTSGVTSNAFIRIKYGTQQRYYTRVVKQSLQPIWNESFVYPYSSAVNSITLTLYDCVSFGRDTLIGDAIIACPTSESSFAAWKDITPRESWGVKDLGRRIVERSEQEYVGQVYVVASLLNPMQLTAIRSDAGFSGQNFLRLSKMTSFTSMDNPLSDSPASCQRSFHRQSVDSTVGAFYIYFVLNAVRIRLLATRFSTWKHISSLTRCTSKQLETLKMQLMESKYLASTQLQKITSLEEKLSSRQQERIEGEVAALRARDDIRLALEEAAARADAAEEQLCLMLDKVEAAEVTSLAIEPAVPVTRSPAAVHFFVSTIRRCCSRRLKRKFDAWKWETYLHYSEALNNTRLQQIESQQQVEIQKVVLQHSNSISLSPELRLEPEGNKMMNYVLAMTLRMCGLRRLKRRFDAWKWETYMYYAESLNHQRLHEINLLARRESISLEEQIRTAIEPEQHPVVGTRLYHVAVLLQQGCLQRVRRRFNVWKWKMIEHRLCVSQKVEHENDKQCMEITAETSFILDENDQSCENTSETLLKTSPIDNRNDDLLISLPPNVETSLAIMTPQVWKGSVLYLHAINRKLELQCLRPRFDSWKRSVYEQENFNEICEKSCGIVSDAGDMQQCKNKIEKRAHDMFTLAVVVRDISLTKLKCAFAVWSWNALIADEAINISRERQFIPQEGPLECITYDDGSVENLALSGSRKELQLDVKSAIEDTCTSEQDDSVKVAVDIMEHAQLDNQLEMLTHTHDMHMLQSAISTLEQQVEVSNAAIDHYKRSISYVVNKISPMLSQSPATSPMNIERISKFPKTVMKKLHDRVGDKSFDYDRKIAFSSALQLVEDEQPTATSAEETPWVPLPPQVQRQESTEDVMVVNPAVEAAMNAVVTPHKGRRKSQAGAVPPSTTKKQNTFVPMPPASGDSNEYLDYVSQMAKSYDGAEGQGSNVRVAIRMRPMNSREESVSMQKAVEMIDATSLSIVDIDTTQEHKYTFDYCFDASVVDRSSGICGIQDTVFEKVGIEILASAWKGYNTSIFAYGQTGSGKSFSMVGSPSDKGIIPRVCHALFHMIDDERRTRCDALFKVEASYLEIYNEKVRDLLDSSGVNLRVREHPTLGVFVEDLSQCAVESYRDVEDLIEMGLQQRTTAATNMNSESSRSHSVFTISIRRETEECGKSCSRMSKLCLIDLAGSERANATGATGARLKEGANINKSLSTLGRCIAALAKASTETVGQDGKKTLIPFRESVLTWLLRESLCGNAKTTMLATISPSAVQYGETLSTLRYANSAKQITTRAVINEDPTMKIIEELRNEVLRLRNQLLSNMSQNDSSLQRNLQAAEECLRVHATDWEAKRTAMMNVKSKLLSRRYAVFDGEELTDEQLQHTPQLLALSNDWQLNRSLKVYLPPNKALHIGKRSETSTPDLQVDGVGIDVDHCSLYYDTDLHRAYLYTNGASVTYVNGRQLSDNEPCTVPLDSRDRVVLGVCSHVFCFLIDESDDVVIPSYSQAIREVVMGRMETEREKHERLAALVWNTWRTPYYRKIFEDMLIDALRAVREATMIAKSMCPSSGLFFEAVSNAPIDISSLHSLRINDLFSYNNISFRVRCNCTIGAKCDFPQYDTTYSRASHLARQSMAAGVVPSRTSLRKQRSTLPHFDILISASGGEITMLFESSVTAFMEGLSVMRMLDTSSSGLRRAIHSLRHEPCSPDSTVSLLYAANVIASASGVAVSRHELSESSDVYTIVCDIALTMHACGLDQNLYVEMFYYFKQSREQADHVPHDYMLLSALDALESCLYEGILQCFATTEVLTTNSNVTQTNTPDVSMLQDVLNDLVSMLGTAADPVTYQNETESGDWTYHVDEGTGKQFAYSASLNESRWME